MVLDLLRACVLFGSLVILSDFGSFWDIWGVFGLFWVVLG